MRKILLIGGSPCSGKSTLSEYLCSKYNFQYIKVDDYMGKHIDEADEKQHPILYKWKTTPWFELFSREVDVQLEEEINFYYEEWEFLKRDILNDDMGEDLIIEGCGLLPSLVTSLYNKSHIFYMIPEEKFQIEKYSLRDWAFDILKEADDPKKAFDNWMNRDIRFAKYIKQEAESLYFPVFITDGRKTVEEMAADIISQIKSEQ